MPHDSVARSELDDPDVIGYIVRRLTAAFVEPISAGGAMVPVKASLGVAMGQANAPVDRLLKLADDAMYRAKHSGRTVLFTALPSGVSVTTEL